mgnify:CR=1 FL=1
MNDKCIPVERFNSPETVVNQNIYKISELYDIRGVERVSRPHRLHFSALIYVTDGEGIHHVDHKRYVVRKGTLLTLGKNQIHSFTKERTIEGYVLPFNCTILSNSKKDPYFDVMITALAHINCIPNIEPASVSLLDALIHQLHSTSAFKAEIVRNLTRAVMLTTIVPHFQMQVEHPYQTTTSEFHRLKQYIEQHFQDRPSVADIALALGKSIKQVDKLAKDNSGDSVKELIDERVLLEAKRLLAFSQHSITDISSQLGFNEATNMTKFFKRHTEISPKDFRQLCRMGLHQK